MTGLIAMTLGVLGALYAVAPLLRGGDVVPLPDREGLSGLDERGEVDAQRAWSVYSGELAGWGGESNNEART